MITFCLMNGIAHTTGGCADPVELAPCEYEDSADCYWNADERGNLIGNSFIDIDGLIFTWTPENEGAIQ